MFSVERNLWNTPTMKGDKFGCQQFKEKERLDLSKQWEFNNPFGYGRYVWHKLCLYNDQSIKYYSRLKKSEYESANKYQDF